MIDWADILAADILIWIRMCVSVVFFVASFMFQNTMVMLSQKIKENQKYHRFMSDTVSAQRIRI